MDITVAVNVDWPSHITYMCLIYGAPPPPPEFLERWGGDERGNNIVGPRTFQLHAYQKLSNVIDVI
jgi:hypothetical protein